MFPLSPGWRSCGFDLDCLATVLPYASLRQRGVVFLPAFSEPYMNLIALDTSTEFLSLAIAIDGMLLNEHQHVGQRHAELTLPLLRSLLGLESLESIKAREAADRQQADAESADWMKTWGLGS